MAGSWKFFFPIFVVCLVASSALASFDGKRYEDRDASRIDISSSSTYPEHQGQWEDLFLLFSDKKYDNSNIIHSKKALKLLSNMNKKSNGENKNMGKTRAASVKNEGRYGPFGSEDGNEFDDISNSTGSAIKRILIHSDPYALDDKITFITTVYVDGTTTFHGAFAHFTDGYTDIHMQLDEKIESLKIGVASHVRFIEFHTSFGRTISVGKRIDDPDYKEHTVSENGSYLNYFFGTEGNSRIQSLGCGMGATPMLQTPEYLEYKDMTREELDKVVTMKGPYKNVEIPEGDAFSDADVFLKSASPIKTVQVYFDDSSASRVRNINFIYADGSTTGREEDSRFQLHELHLEENENVIYVRLYLYYFINGIEIGTDQGRTFEVKSRREEPYTALIKAEGKRLLFLEGTILDIPSYWGGTVFDSLSFGFGPVPGENPGGELPNPVDYSSMSWQEFQEITTKEDAIGLGNGLVFDDERAFQEDAHSPITSISVYSSNFIHSIVTQYQNGYETQLHGIPGGTETKITLEDGEHIKSVEVMYDIMLRYMEFITTRNRAFRVGTYGGDQSGILISEKNEVVLYFHGKVGNGLHSLGAGFGPPATESTSDRT